MNRDNFIKSIYTAHKMQGLNAMSISDITGIPRATVIRKLKALVEHSYLKIDAKKHYRLTGNFIQRLAPLQTPILNKLANFSSQIFNLHILNKKNERSIGE